MSSLQKNNDQPYLPDDSIYKPRPESRLALPDDRMLYEEVQNFNQLWIWTLLGVELLVVLITLILTHIPYWSIAIAMIGMVLPLALLGSMKLYTRMDYLGIHYRMTVFQRKERTIPWEDIDQIYVRKYSPLLEYGGWGIRYGPKGKALNVRGNYGIQILKKDGKRLLLGTQQPDEASNYLSRHLLLV